MRPSTSIHRQRRRPDKALLIYCAAVLIIVNLPLVLACWRLPPESWPTLVRHAPNQFVFLLVCFPMLPLALVALHRIGRETGLLGERARWLLGLATLALAIPIAVLDHRSDQPDWYVTEPAMAREAAREQQAIHAWFDRQPGWPGRADLLASDWYAERARQAARERRPTPLVIETIYRWGAAADPLMDRLEEWELIAAVQSILFASLSLTAILVTAVVRRLPQPAMLDLQRRLTYPVALLIIGGSLFAVLRGLNVYDIELIKQEVVSIPPGIMLVGAFICLWQWLLLRFCSTRLIDRQSLLLVALVTVPAVTALLMERFLPGTLAGSTGLARDQVSNAILYIALACLVETGIAVAVLLHRERKLAIA